MKRARLVTATVWWALASSVCADIPAQLAEAAKPLTDGVPEVAIVRLQNLLKQNLAEEDWRAGAEKLLEAMVTSHRTDEAFNRGKRGDRARLLEQSRRRRRIAKVRGKSLCKSRPPHQRTGTDGDEDATRAEQTYAGAEERRCHRSTRSSSGRRATRSISR